MEAKPERLEQEMKSIRAERRAIVHASYEEYQKTLMPAQWAYLPRTIDVCAMGPFAEVLNAAADVTITRTDFEDAFDHLPELLAADSDPPNIGFSAEGSKIAAAVVRAAGLDERVATVVDMGAKTKDIRFGCSICPPARRGRVSWTKAGYKCREFVRLLLFQYFLSFFRPYI